MLISQVSFVAIFICPLLPNQEFAPTLGSYNVFMQLQNDKKKTLTILLNLKL